MQNNTLALLEAFVLASPRIQKIFIKNEGVETLTMVVSKSCSQVNRNMAAGILEACLP